LRDYVEREVTELLFKREITLYKVAVLTTRCNSANYLSVTGDF